MKQAAGQASRGFMGGGRVAQGRKRTGQVGGARGSALRDWCQGINFDNRNEPRTEVL
jgi:hypothetical protein